MTFLVDNLVCKYKYRLCFTHATCFRWYKWTKSSFRCQRFGRNWRNC